MKIRLHEKTFIHGRIHEPGEIVEVAHKEDGPHRAMRRMHDTIDYEPGNGLDANHVPGAHVDKPLFDMVED